MALAAAGAVQAFTPVPDIKPVLQIKQIVGQTEAAVAKMLGKAASCEQSKYGRRCEYRKSPARYEVVFIKGKADWITVEDPRIDNALTAPVWIGLPAKPVDVGTSEVLRWNGLGGLLEVSAYKGSGGRPSYLYIKSVTR
ncbi:hypothetical protein [Crenobacter cavernae]|uniref:hypothetical protein n=1 Tax=Crenobacter cavernae TaxID=2290923 RepID=UPI0011C056AE|nr:hypothetical protein [Crenobacter cavernae]